VVPFPKTATSSAFNAFLPAYYKAVNHTRATKSLINTQTTVIVLWLISKLSGKAPN